MKPIDFTASIYIDFCVKSNYKNPIYEVGDHVRRSKYKKLFAKGYTSNGSEEVLVIKEVKNSVLWMYFISDLNAK